jgi:hypothetical protein
LTRKPSKSLQQLAAEANGGSAPMQIAGQPADVCPYCGAAMFAYGTQTLGTRIDRYVKCRNNNCGKRFLSRQPTPQAPTIVREVGSEDDNFSNAGMARLTVVRESA